MDNVELVFTEAALDAAAEEALKQKTGARGLRSILEQTLLDVMYELPSERTGASAGACDSPHLRRKAVVFCGCADSPAPGKKRMRARRRLW